MLTTDDPGKARYQGAMSVVTPHASPPKPARGPNAQRRNATRAKLLEATIGCLSELGYHRTSTVLVTERAGVSRGSLLHQFPSKADLMVAAAGYIAELRGRAHVAGLEGVPLGPERLTRLVDILWGQMSSPSGVARLEIMLGSRSDPELAAKLAPLHARLDERHRDAVWALAKALGATDRKPIDAMVQLYAASLRGLSVDALFPESREHVSAAVELLKTLLVDVISAQAKRPASS